MIINIFTIVGGVWSSKEGWVSGEVRCVACTAPALLQSSVRRFIRRKPIEFC